MTKESPTTATKSLHCSTASRWKRNTPISVSLCLSMGEAQRCRPRQQRRSVSPSAAANRADGAEAPARSLLADTQGRRDLCRMARAVLWRRRPRAGPDILDAYGDRPPGGGGIGARGLGSREVAARRDRCHLMAGASGPEQYPIGYDRP